VPKTLTATLTTLLATNRAASALLPAEEPEKDVLHFTVKFIGTCYAKWPAHD
jgi:hypothetical protein